MHRRNEGNDEEEKNNQGQAFHRILLTYVEVEKIGAGVREISTGTADNTSSAKIIL
jgi:hypothetical protein